jgi:hypothetical protein
LATALIASVAENAGENVVSYVKRVLVRNQKLRYAIKLHWTVFAPGLLILVPGVIVSADLLAMIASPLKGNPLNE